MSTFNPSQPVSEYVAIIFDVADPQRVTRNSIAQAAEHFVLTFGDEAILSVCRADFSEDGAR